MEPSLLSNPPNWWRVDVSFNSSSINDDKKTAEQDSDDDQEDMEALKKKFKGKAKAKPKAKKSKK